MYASSSVPRPHVPDAVMTGFFSDTEPMLVQRCDDRERIFTAGDIPEVI
jgi:hypothetical protein